MLHGNNHSGMSQFTNKEIIISLFDQAFYDESTSFYWIIKVSLAL